MFILNLKKLKRLQREYWSRTTIVDSADYLARLLNIAGHELRVPYDGPTALALAIKFHPKVVLLDIGIPGLTG